MNNINNNVNFTARMDLKKVSINKAKWENIATLFEQKTAKYPNDTFYMEDLANGISGYNINSKTGQETSVNIFGVEFDKLMNMPDSKIVAKFKKILDISNHKQQIFNATEQYTKKLFNISNNPIEDTKIWNTAVEIADKEAKTLQQKDSFLCDIDIMF